MTSTPVPLLAARGVSRTFGARVALAPVALDVFHGEALALIGPNGAGKSTLLSILAGALAPTAGEIRFEEPRPRVGWVPQRPALYGRLTAYENLVLFARLERSPEPERVARDLLDLVEIPVDERHTARLSGGNQQRLNLAVALLGDPDVLLLDEPTASLDPRQRRRFWKIVDRVRARGGAVVFATQNLDELDTHADRVAVLNGGELVFAGTRAEYEIAPEARVFA
jgi:ABC-type multidrug transport system ATPase subunit